MSSDFHVDGMSIAILKDKETGTYADYVFVADVWGSDPRYKSRRMQIGQCRGLFRIDKDSLQVNLLRPMQGDETGNRFSRAAGKVLKEHQATGEFPDATQFASG